MQIVNLQIVPTGINPVINVSQFDVGREFKLVLYDGAVAYTLPSGATARIEGKKPDGNGFSYTDAVAVTNNTLTITTKDQMTVLCGDVKCEVRLYKSGLDIGTLNFILRVEASPIDGDTDMSETDIPAIIELASQQERNAEAWAVGTKGGLPVEETEPQYHNNAKYYSDNADEQAEAAATSASHAHDSEIAAASSESNAEAWAVGERGGVPVTSGDETYENNSKYYADEAENSATAADTSASNAYDSEQAAKLSEQNAKNSEDILAYYADFAIPRFLIVNNRLYVSNNSVGNFIVVNNRLYVASPS